MSSLTNSTPEGASPSPATGRSTAWHAALLVASQLVANACTFLTGIVVARALGAAGKGYYDLAVGSATLLAGVLGFSLGSGVLYYASRGGVDHRRLSGALVAAALAQGVVVGAVLLASHGHPFVAWLLPSPGSRTAAVLVAVLVAVLQLQQTVRGIVIGRGDVPAFALLEMVGRAGALAGLAALAVAGVDGAPIFVLVFAAAMAGNAAGLTGVAIRPRPNSAALPLLGIASYSLPLYIGNLVQLLNYRLDIFIINSYLDIVAVGLYTVAAMLAQSLWLVPNALAIVVTRQVAEAGETGRSLALAAEVTRFCVWSCGLGALAMAAVGSVALVAVFGPEFSATLQPLYVLLPGVALFAPAVVLSAYLNGIRKQIYTTWVACGALAVTLVLNLALVPVLGISGAALASSASYTVSSVATIAVVLRRSPALSLADLIAIRATDIARIIALARRVLGRAPAGERG